MLCANALDEVAAQLQATGWCVVDEALDASAAAALATHALGLTAGSLHRGGVGRGTDHHTANDLRRDDIVWLSSEATPDRLWLDAMAHLKAHLNQHLYLGLQDYEAHYARYAPGAFYGRHVDAFKGQSNRFVSTVYYLNADWPSSADHPDDTGLGGELLLYPSAEAQQASATIAPRMGRLVVFLSEDLPHEVLPAVRTRHSIAGWFRLKA